MSYTLGRDEGTTSARAVVFDREGRIRSVAQRSIELAYPQPGWVELDPQEMWSTRIGVAVEALERASLSVRDVAAVGIANQRETIVTALTG